MERGEKTGSENKKGRYSSISGDMFLKAGFKNSHYVNFLVLLIARTRARKWRSRDGKVLVLALDKGFSLEKEIALDVRQSNNHP